MPEPKFFDRDLLKTDDQRMREKSADLYRQQRNADNAPAFEMRSLFGFRVELAPASPAALARRAVCGAMAEQVVEWRNEQIADDRSAFLQGSLNQLPVGRGSDTQCVSPEPMPELMDFEGFHILVKEIPLKGENSESFFFYEP